jgi:RNA polymerase sigma factor (sigma-70 family)
VTDGVFVQAYPMAKRAVACRAVAMRFGAAAREDLEQQVALGLLRALPRFDHDRGCLATFVEVVARNQMASFLRNLGMHRVASESLDDYQAGMIAASDNLDLRADVDCVLRRVPAFDRDVALQLMEHSPAEAARRLGVCRPRVYRAIERLRAAFCSAGFGSSNPCRSRRRVQIETRPGGISA